MAAFTICRCFQIGSPRIQYDDKNLDSSYRGFRMLCVFEEESL